ncbi:MAG: histidine--tRNA ligase [Bacteroidia bacterium]|nr:MAG: histidine--tRNA ligase [Bacteroidia bacterium]
MSKKIGQPKGVRDFSPQITEKRNYIFEIIKEVYRKFGYKPIETPAMENLSTLTGKYGEEGDRLLFKILNSGDFLKNIPEEEYAKKNSKKMTSLIAEKGLRYDLTVPFARYVVQHRNELTFPFKRSQIQTVWRADRPQKGRYREFYQCDADIIGSESLLNEWEMLQMIDEVFFQLNLKVQIKINNRKLLAGIAEYVGYPDKFNEITVALDKKEKIGMEKVLVELQGQGFSEESLQKLQEVLPETKETSEILSNLETHIGSIPEGRKGLDEINELLHYCSQTVFRNTIVLDTGLARGLNYYTGTIIEVISDEVSFSSICGGGRYDNLTGIFGWEGMSGVGISFGADRIYDILEQLNRFPEEAACYNQILFVNLGDEEIGYILPLLSMLRMQGVSAQLYPDASKMKKQMQYADRNKISHVVIAGEEEMKKNKFTLKNMHTGEQALLSKDELLQYFSQEI